MEEPQSNIEKTKELDDKCEAENSQDADAKGVEEYIKVLKQALAEVIEENEVVIFHRRLVEIKGG